MANNKVSYGQYVAYAVGNSARFSVSGRPGLIKRGDVPENIAVHLETQLGLEPKETKSNLACNLVREACTSTVPARFRVSGSALLLSL